MATRHNRLYHKWCNMKARCNNTNNPRYKNYGGRGISICIQWEYSFSDFKSWALKNNYTDNLTIDRRDNNKGYTPENCHFITNEEQQSNRTNNHIIEFNGETRTLSQWAKLYGRIPKTLEGRLTSGWPIPEAITMPLVPKRKDSRNVRFGQLVAVSFSHRHKGRTYWNCICDCGNHKKIRIDQMRSGIITNCDHRRKEKKL